MNIFEKRILRDVRRISRIPAPAQRKVVNSILMALDQGGERVRSPAQHLINKGSIWIFDWKTGRPDKKNQNQIVLYALFAAAKWDADPDKVKGAPVYLLEGGEFDPKPVTAEDRGRVAEIMRESIAAMKDRLTDADKNEASEEKFEATPGYACRSCNFRGVCPDAR